MKRVRITLLVMLIAAIARAEDIETLDHKVYKNATITRAEPDGIVLRHSAGIVKIPFTDLPQEFSKRYNYDSQAAKAFKADVEEKQAAIYVGTQAAKAMQQEKVSEIAAKAEAEREQKKAILRERAAEEAKQAQRAASVKAAIQHGGIIPGMTGDECIQASGKPQFVKRTTNSDGTITEKWIYGAGYVYFENGIVTTIENFVDGEDPRAKE